jgi:hypothetical protein
MRPIITSTRSVVRALEVIWIDDRTCLECLLSLSRAPLRIATCVASCFCCLRFSRRLTCPRVPEPPPAAAAPKLTFRPNTPRQNAKHSTLSDRPAAAALKITFGVFELLAAIKSSADATEPRLDETSREGRCFGGPPGRVSRAPVDLPCAS